MNTPLSTEPRNPFRNPTQISMTGDVSIPATSNYIVRVTSDQAGRILTVPTGQSHLIQSESSYSITVEHDGSSGTTLQPGTEIRVTWDAPQSAHEEQLVQATVDTAMSGTSTNAVQNKVAKSYIDTAVASAGVEDNTIAALRARTDTPDRVYVKGYATTGDGGEGFFRLLASSGGTTGDVGSGGEDDDGWHIVCTTTTAVYGREADIARPEHFGAFGHDLLTEVEAATSDDYTTKMQRFVDFVLQRDEFPGWDYVKGRKHPKGIVPDRYYQCQSTVNIDIANESPMQDGQTCGDLIFQGQLFTKYSTDITAFSVSLRRTSGKPKIKLRCVKGRNVGVDNRVKWDSVEWADLYRNPDAYRAWAATTAFYDGEFITQLHGDGSTHLYEVTQSGTTASTSPTHTSGETTDGTAKLTALGTVKNTSGQTVKEQLKKNSDIGVHLQWMAEVTDFQYETFGYAVACNAVPKAETGSSIGFSKIQARNQFGCKVGVLLSRFRYDEEVANQTARLALTGLPLGYVVWQTDDGVNEYVFDGPIGGEATSGNWSSRTRNGSDNWTNENEWDLGLQYGRGNGGLIGTDQSVYGMIFSAYNAAGGPTGNYVPMLSVEFSGQTGNAESVQYVFETGAENEVACRNDAVSLNTVAVIVHHPETDSAQEAERNLIKPQRANLWFSDPRTHINNARNNRIAEVPRNEDFVHQFSIPSLTEDANFSGANKVFWTRGSTQQSDNLGAYDEFSFYRYGLGSNYFKFNPDDLTWDVTSQDALSVMVDIPENDNSDAMVEVILHTKTHDTATDNGIRTDVVIYDPITNAPADFSGRPREPLHSEHLGYSQTGDGAVSIYRWLSAANRHEPTRFGLEPWVKRCMVRMWGNGLTGYTVRLYRAPGGRVYSFQKEGWGGGLRYTDAIPKRGIFYPPYRAYYVDQTGTNKGFYLNKADGTGPWYATDGNSSTAATTEGNWAHDGAGTLQIYNGSSWDTLLSSVNVVETTDFTEFT